ncbi:MAG: hypothetical protein J7K96_04710 [Desulfobacteraceae bacterium]|nr:hypothetical protein [Desulfobacteraceae bacterium]
MKTMMDFIAAALQEKVNKPRAEETAANISSILSALYRRRSESEWEWLRLNRPDWWQQRIKLENDLDGHFPTGDQKAGQEVFYQLVEHLKTAPVGHKSTKQ